MKMKKMEKNKNIIKKNRNVNIVLYIIDIVKNLL